MILLTIATAMVIALLGGIAVGIAISLRLDDITNAAHLLNAPVGPIIKDGELL